MRAISKAILPMGLLVALSIQILAQNKEMRIGDSLPDIKIGQILGKKDQSINIKDLYNGKLLIIDFWATWCVPCIVEMKFLDSLKAMHPDKFSVLMVTNEDRKLVEDFLKKPNNKDITTSNLILTTNDTVLHSLFPHRGIPHNIWIDKEGRVKTITGGDGVTEKNILGFNKSENISKIDVKSDNMNFEATARQFHAGDTSFTYRSIITPAIKGINSGGELYIPVGDKVSRFFMWGGSILRAYWSAYSGINQHMRYHLMEVHTNDSLRFYPPDGKLKHLLNGSRYSNRKSWEIENTYFYDLALPRPVSFNTLRNYMFEDLERQFNIKASIENRKTLCMIVTKKSGKSLLKSIETSSMVPKITMSIGYKISIKNATIDNVLEFLFKRFGKTSDLIPYPFINKVKKDKSLRFDLEMDFSNEIDNKSPLITPKMIYNHLSKYGFQFNLKPTMYPLLILYDNNN